MFVYKITRFSALDIDKVDEVAETIRHEIYELETDFIDMMSYENSKNVVIVKYPNQETMNAATGRANQAFAQMVAAGVIDEGSVHPHTGDEFKSFSR